MERATPVSWLARLTAAPGTAEPDGSLITPVISASPVWPAAAHVKRTARTATAIPRRRTGRNHGYIRSPSNYGNGTVPLFRVSITWKTRSRQIAVCYGHHKRPGVQPNVRLNAAINALTLV